MSRAKRLKIVETLAQQREEHAAQALSQVRTQLETEQNRLNELTSYRAEYLTYLDQAATQGVAMEQWRRTQGFIDQLASLAQNQQSVIDNWQAREAQLLETWRSLYQRRKNIASFIDKISVEEMIEADKVEQKKIDELISQRFR